MPYKDPKWCLTEQNINHVESQVENVRSSHLSKKEKEIFNNQWANFTIFCVAYGAFMIVSLIVVGMCAAWLVPDDDVMLMLLIVIGSVLLEVAVLIVVSFLMTKDVRKTFSRARSGDKGA